MTKKNLLSQYGFFKNCCRLCKSKDLFKFLDLGYHPPSDEFKKKTKLNHPTLYFPLQVCSCNKCGFKQLNFVINPSYLYQNDYPYESSLTQAGYLHYNKFSENVISKFNLSSNDLVIDIGSNIGTLLKGFKKKKIKILGIDPAKNICKIANANGIGTYNGFFDRQFVNFLRKKKQKAKVITATNVFAHIDNLDDFFRNIKKIINQKDGVLIIESPHFLHLVKNLEYDTIYHEHLSYILVKPLMNFLKRHNFQIFDVIKKDIHGGSIRIFISKTNSFKVHKNVKQICKDEINMKLYSNKNLNKFSNAVKINRYNLICFLTKLKLKRKKIIAVSAPAKGMTLLNYAKIDKNYIDFATEKSYLKINRYSPGGNIPILKDSDISKHKPDYALLLAWNFSKEIIRNNINFLKKGGKFIIPIPKLKIINYKNYK